MIPAFEDDGNLPAGVYRALWREVEQRFGTGPHRKRLLRGLHSVLVKLEACGCETVYVDGSFVTSEPLPSDFDGAWEVAGVDLQELYAAEPSLFDFSNRRAAQKAKFLGEMFPAEMEEGDSGRTFVEFFQQDKNTGKPKGILAIDLRTL